MVEKKFEFLTRFGLYFRKVHSLFVFRTTYQGLYAARFFLGVAEAGFFPAATYLLTIWYQRYEVQRRMAVFYAAASLVRNSFLPFF